MSAEDIEASSPFTTLEQAIRGAPDGGTTASSETPHTGCQGALGAGHLGVVMARAGVGKTAFVVQLGLEAAVRDFDVLHVALGQSLEHVQAWYDALLDDLIEVSGVSEPDELRIQVARRRIIQAYSERHVSPERLGNVIDRYCEQLGMKPRTLLIDGYDWEGPSSHRSDDIKGFKALAEKMGAALWMSAQTHRKQTTAHPTSLTPPCQDFAELIDVAIFLSPIDEHVSVRLLKVFDRTPPQKPVLKLDCDTMRPVSRQGAPSSVRLPRQAYTLLSGGAAGAEAAFGAAAERWGVGEVTYSFPGRTCERSHSVVELSEAELRRGEVSATYVESHLHRTFPKTPTFQKTLQTIWHQVETAGQVFVVGSIQPDGTVRGGTGWAAELARHFKKSLFVFDQDQNAWFRWGDDSAWHEVETPRICRTRFAGTGTRFLTSEGEAAITQLFESSFGPA